PDALSASLAASILSTDNDRDANALSRQAAAARLEWAPAAPLTLGATCRLAENDYHEPGMLHDPSSAGHALSRFAIATLYAEARPLASLASRLTLGLVKNSYRWDQTAYPSRMDARRLVLDWQNTFRPNPRLLLLAGLNAETSRYNNAGATLRDDLRSAFFNLTLEPFATPSATTRRDTGLTLVLGARADDYDTFNTRLTHRAGLAWRPAKAAPVFRANYGTGFNAPSPSYLLGGGWYAPSPTLKPERSKGWDFSLEQDLFNGQAAAGAAWFKNEFKDKFDFSTYDPVTWQTRVGNIPGAVTQGVELFLNVRPSPQKIPALRLAYTYLDARDSAGRRLVSQPRHLLSADANHRVLPNWLVGAGLTLVAGRPDESYYDPATFSNVPQEMASHTLVRLYTAWDVTARVTLRLRAENLLDTTYQPVADYPGLPFSLHASLQWKF
ncbi:MAG: TonB-dependent receptor, partial [Opitutaceae bacterium]|nr:TonB-dependent receptor [Opitutaceae bacterium]